MPQDYKPDNREPAETAERVESAKQGAESQPAERRSAVRGAETRVVGAQDAEWQRAELRRRGASKDAADNTDTAERIEAALTPGQDAYLNPHDTHLPPSRLSPLVQRILVGLFLLFLLVAVIFLGLERWRRATMVVGCSLLYLALIRYYVDSKILGVFSVRSRRVDIAFNTAMGLAIITLASSVDPLI